MSLEKRLIGSLFANPILIILGLLGIGVFFMIGYVVLWAWGMVTAAIFFAAGLFLVFIVGKMNRDYLNKHVYLVLLPVGLGAVGYASDHFPKLEFLSVTGGGSTPVNNVLVAVGVIAVAVALIVLAKPKHKKRKR